ncbi:MAG TPA: beta-1,6-N-acetylglucosaminyltransferase [Thermoanaerobaculia bacterium]|jgi:hypothetical protein
MTATVCYFVQTHRDPEQIYRLLRRLRAGSPRAPIVVVHDFANCDLDTAPLAELDVHLLRPARPMIRTDYGCQVQTYLDVVDWLERERISYDWLVNLTGQDYPVRPVAAIEAFLGGATCDGFIDFWDVRSSASPWSWRKARARYWYRYWRLSPQAEPVLRALRPLTRFLPLHVYLDYGALLGVRALRTPFHQGFRCHGGWPWFSLPRRTVLYLRDFLAAHPEVVRHYRGTVIPEESIVPTVLVNSGRFELVNDSHRYIDYSRAVKGAPRTLTVADLPALASGRYHFARKFDLAVDREVLDRIDRELLGMAPPGPPA